MTEIRQISITFKRNEFFDNILLCSVQTDFIHNFSDMPHELYTKLMDGWMTWDFTSFSTVTVFRSHHDYGRVIHVLKGYVQWNPLLRLSRFCLELGSNSGPVDQ